MKQLRGNKGGGNARKKSSPSGKDSRNPALQASEDSRPINILNPKLLAQKRPLQGLSSMGGSTAGSPEDAKRPKLLPEVNSPGQESEDEESDDSEYERAESESDDSDYTDSEDDDDDETGSDASESSNKGPEETTSQPSSKTDLTKGKR